MFVYFEVPFMCSMTASALARNAAFDAYAGMLFKKSGLDAKKPFFGNIKSIKNRPLGNVCQSSFVPFLFLSSWLMPGVSVSCASW